LLFSEDCGSLDECGRVEVEDDPDARPAQAPNEAQWQALRDDHV
jgi:hypothetical protein